MDDGFLFRHIQVSTIYRTLGISWNLNVRHDTCDEPLQKKQNVAETLQFLYSLLIIIMCSGRAFICGPLSGLLKHVL